MRAPFDSMFRWWWSGVSHTNGNGHADRPVFNEKSPEPQVPIEPPWLAQLDKDDIPRTLRYPTITLGRIIDQAAARFADNPALIYNHETWTWRELLSRVNRFAGGLARAGVRTGDRIVLALPNCPDFVVSFFAIQKLGAVVVNAGPLMGADDLRHVMEATAPRLVIGLDLLAAKLREAAKAHPQVRFVWVSLQIYQPLIRRIGYQVKLWQNHRTNGSGAPVDDLTVAKLLENAPSRPPTVEPSQHAVALLQPTSGTTGLVKLVELTHANLLANATQTLAFMSPRDGQESVLTVLPMFHIFGLLTGLINPIYCCASIILMTRFDVEAVVNLLIERKPSVFPLVPAICDAISNEIEHRDPRPVLPKMRLCMTGAAPLPREVAERFERLTGSRVLEGYGLSEASPVTHANLVSRPRYGSIGLPLPDTHCQIVDINEGTQSLATGQPGELMVSGPQVMRGYYHDPQATQQALWTDPHGRIWLRTGDIARMDEDGFFQIMDRKKDMIIHSGLKVYPAKVEKVLGQHPRISDVAVIGQSDPIHTEEVVAVVVLKPSGRELEDRVALTEEFQTLCRKHLATYEVPHRFIFKDQIPRSPLGKILKTALRQQLNNTVTESPISAGPPKKEASQWSHGTPTRIPMP